MTLENLMLKGTNKELTNYKEAALRFNQQVLNRDGGQKIDNYMELMKSNFEYNFYGNMVMNYFTNFEVYIKNCISYTIEEYPQIISKKKITIKELLNLSKDELLIEKIDHHVSEIMWKGIEEAIKYSSGTLGIDYNLADKQSDDLDYIRNTRNLLVHKDGTVDNLFIKKTNSKELTVGERFPLTKDLIDEFRENLFTIAVNFDEAFLKKFPSLANETWETHELS